MHCRLQQIFVDIPTQPFPGALIRYTTECREKDKICLPAHPTVGQRLTDPRLCTSLVCFLWIAESTRYLGRAALMEFIGSAVRNFFGSATNGIVLSRFAVLGLRLHLLGTSCVCPIFRVLQNHELLGV